MVNRPGERARPLLGTCCLLILRDCPWTQRQDENGEPENAPVDLVLSRHSHDSPRGPRLWTSLQSRDGDDDFVNWKMCPSSPALMEN